MLKYCAQVWKQNWVYSQEKQCSKAGMQVFQVCSQSGLSGIKDLFKKKKKVCLLWFIVDKSYAIVCQLLFVVLGIYFKLL